MEKVSIENRASVFDILKKYKLNSTKVAIELNGIIVPRSLQKKKLKINDKIEVVQFIAGLILKKINSKLIILI